MKFSVYLFSPQDIDCIMTVYYYIFQLHSRIRMDLKQFRNYFGVWAANTSNSIINNLLTFIYLFTLFVCKLLYSCLLAENLGRYFTRYLSTGVTFRKFQTETLYLIYRERLVSFHCQCLLRSHLFLSTAQLVLAHFPLSPSIHCTAKGLNLQLLCH